jgi:hypothetical protein
MSIDTNWEDYFTNHYEGLGTTYERFILHRYFKKLWRNGEVRSVLEAPSFGMTGISGINSMWWALHGAKVVVVDTDEKRVDLVRKTWTETGLAADFVVARDWVSLPFSDKSFDLSWNFAALWQVDEVEAFLKELSRVTSQSIMICAPNSSNVVSHLNRAAKGREGGSRRAVSRDWNALISVGWRLEEWGFFDVPPWPDICMKKEDLLRAFGMKRIAGMLERELKDAPCILDYYRGQKDDLEGDVMKYSFLENLPSFPKKLWAHHQYFIFSSAC